MKDMQASPKAALKGQVGGKGDPSEKRGDKAQKTARPSRDGVVGTWCPPEVDKGSGGGCQVPTVGQPRGLRTAVACPSAEEYALHTCGHCNVSI